MTRSAQLLLACLAYIYFQSLTLVSAGRQRYAVLKEGDEPMLQGTWSSGSGKVVTGSGFFNPRTRSFIAPTVPGQAYSFTRDGYWELAKYRVTPNPRKPECITSQLIWQHGTYFLHSNGTLQLYPITREGAQLLTSSCSGASLPEEMYDVAEEYTMVDTWVDLHHGLTSAALRLTDAWGNRSPSLWKIYDPPMMLPTEPLYLEYIGIP
ncbi:related to ROT1 - molecular chaperone in the endoplasmic reticulum [Melanopsichium pennsylvanicum]|uniref:Protein ROT1 n=2 Tax=Melanopsichium pennsylvanicum TaxID=63383 RepID=A0AAJ4XKS4_9BASI|nr:related to ROT1-molecular chaperone in the endoplasmic reticulum [Melanopsichium pennsylvanicum 4]SNX83742.1 related to ROT1 - molecular chaperone in the endoplasmic reticulum [Melanopsichium pennsylvanicum]